MRRACLALACVLALLAFGGQMTVGAPAAQASPSLNNEGISPKDGSVTSANFDVGGYSYSNQALAGVGFGSGANVQTQGVTFQWPAVGAGHDDNWQAAGQVIPISPSFASGGLLAFLGAASNGPATGKVTITYLGGTKQTLTLGFSDWTLNGGKSQPMAGNTIAATTSYRDKQNGSEQQVKTYVFYTSQTTLAGKTAISVTLPSSVSKGQLHVFAIGGKTGVFPPNNEGVSPADGAATAANFDGGGYSYSNQALTSAGFGSGAAVTVNGVTFQWPTITTGASDNWSSFGQTIPLTLTGGGVVAFLGASSNGASSGMGSITYTDNSTQSFSLSLSDWTLHAGALAADDGNVIAATTSYRERTTGVAQKVNTYIFYTAIATTPGKTVASVTLPTSATGGQLHVFAVSGVGPTNLPPSPTNWSSYLNGADHSGYNGAETILTSANFGSIQEKWQASGGLANSAQPIESNGVLYWGSWDGDMHATNLAGGAIWTQNLGQNYSAECEPPTVGIASTATIDAIGSTPVVFVGGGNANFYALNANTGAVIWKTSLGATPAHFIWGSPTVYNGSVYIGIASYGDCPLVQGGLYQLNASTGAAQHFFAAAPNGCVGDGIWGTPAIDSTTNTVYFATGNGAACAQTYSDAIIAVSATDLSLVGYWDVPLSQQTADGDFGSAPTLFTAGSRQMLGIANKNGYYYALDRTNLAAGPVWEERIAFDAADCPQCGDGSISPSAWDGSTLYVAGGNTVINSAACQGSVRALDPSNGNVIWEHCFTSGPVLAAVTAIPGVVVVTDGSWVSAVNATTGASVFSWDDPNQSTVFMSAACVVNGRLYAADGSGNLFAFGL